MARQRDIMIPVMSGGLGSQMTVDDFAALTGVNIPNKKPLIATAPAITGSIVVGTPITWTPGTYTAVGSLPVQYETAIFRDGAPITKWFTYPNVPSYIPVNSDKGSTFQVVEVANTSAGYTVNNASAGVVMLPAVDRSGAFYNIPNSGGGGGGIPTVAAPLAVWVNDQNPSKVNVLFNRGMNTANVSGVSLLGKTVSSANVVGSLLSINTATPYVFGDVVSVSMPANAVVPLSGTSAAAISNLVGENQVGTSTLIAADLTNRQSGLTDVVPGQSYTAVTGPRYALLPVKLGEGSSGWVQIDISTSANFATSFGFSDVYDMRAQQDINYYALTGGTGQINRSLNSGTNSAVSYTFAGVAGDKMRLRRDAVAKTITIDTFTAGAWTNGTYTFQGYNDADLYVIVGVHTSGKTLLNPQTFGMVPV